jgi:hypothetical protein
MVLTGGPFPEDRGVVNLTQESSHEYRCISPLRQRMIEDMSARKLNPHTQRSHISSCKRFAAYLNAPPHLASQNRQ